MIIIIFYEKVLQKRLFQSRTILVLDLYNKGLEKINILSKARNFLLTYTHEFI